MFSPLKIDLFEKRIAVISIQLYCVDGVSLEAKKWIASYERLGNKVFTIAGKFCSKPNMPHLVLPEIAADCPMIESIRKMAFEQPLDENEKKHLHKLISGSAAKIRNELEQFIKKYNIDLLHVENVLTIPLNLPLGIALTEIIHRDRLPAIVRHHDFFWERNYYITHNNVPEILGLNFPPKRGRIKHVTISRRARDDLLKWTGINATDVPNYFDFNKVQKIASYNKDFRESFGIGKKDILLLQPTRILERKKIERSIEFAARLSDAMKKRCVLLVTGPPAVNIGPDYIPGLSNKARELNVNLIFGHKKIFLERKTDKEGNKIYSIGDAYANCDMVTFPSQVEGFGNVVIEACLYKKPLFTYKYSVLNEILRKGFEFILMEFNELEEETIKKAKKLLSNSTERKRVVQKNYRLAKKYYSMDKLDATISGILEGFDDGILRDLFKFIRKALG